MRYDIMLAFSIGTNDEYDSESEAGRRSPRWTRSPVISRITFDRATHRCVVTSSNIASSPSLLSASPYTPSSDPSRPSNLEHYKRSQSRSPKMRFPAISISIRTMVAQRGYATKAKVPLLLTPKEYMKLPKVSEGDGLCRVSGFTSRRIQVHRDTLPPLSELMARCAAFSQHVPVTTSSAMPSRRWPSSSPTHSLLPTSSSRN